MTKLPRAFVSPFLVCVFLWLLSCPVLYSRVEAADSEPGRILNDIKKLAVLGRVLYVAAHPDDENTNVITYLRQSGLYDVAYLSLTRGDGGQNLIGSEQGPLLGVIRTQELLQARSIDGGEQYFTRAVDFGFSKNPEETLNIWDRDKVLADVVQVLKEFRPDVVITRFPPDGPGHGHHSASAILARDAFTLVAGSDAGSSRWRPRRLLHNLPHWVEPAPEVLERALKLQVGRFSPFLGRSYPEIAAASRTMHKSQGFGTAPEFGEKIEYFVVVDGEPLSKVVGGEGQGAELIFEGVDTRWSRVGASPRIEEQIHSIVKEFNLQSPAESVPALLELRSSISSIKDDFWRKRKLRDLDQVIASALGLHVRLKSRERSLVPGEAAELTLEVVNRSRFPLMLDQAVVRRVANEKASVDFLSGSPVALLEGKLTAINGVYSLPRDIDYHCPHWLREEPDDGLYTVKATHARIAPDSPPLLSAVLTFSLHDRVFELSVPARFYRLDPREGEQSSEPSVVPPIAGSVAESLFLFPNGNARELSLRLYALAGDRSGTIKVHEPAGWGVEPSTFSYSFAKPGDQAEFRFRVTPPKYLPSRATLRFTVTLSRSGKGKVEPLHGIDELRYPHIDFQTIVRPLEATLFAPNVATVKAAIGFIPGPGEATPGLLTQLGYDVTLLGEEDIRKDLSHFDAIIVGIRALNSSPTFPRGITERRRELLQYVEDGGVLLVQYATNNRLAPLTADIWPYPLTIGTDRVTNEASPVEILAPEHPLLTRPHRISAADFKGWVQERGLYFAKEMDLRWETLLSLRDPGESAIQSSLISAPYGKGRFIYTGLSFFRQLPAAVPGAYRLFINLITPGAQSHEASHE